MTELNPNRMIPLHVADAAVAACEKEIATLRAENERLRASSFVTAVPVEEYEKLKAEVERLRKAVMHSPAAQLKLKELEGKTTYEEINAAKDGKPTE